MKRIICFLLRHRWGRWHFGPRLWGKVLGGIGWRECLRCGHTEWVN